MALGAIHDSRLRLTALGAIHDSRLRLTALGAIHDSRLRLTALTLRAAGTWRLRHLAEIRLNDGMD